MITRLERLRPPRPDRPWTTGPSNPVRAIVEAVAQDSAAWTETVADRVRADYDAQASEWDEWAADGYLDPLEDALDRLELSGADAIDLGCGTGLALEPLQRSFERVVGVDFSSRMLHEAAAARRLVARADLASLPFPDRSFDLVALINAPLFAAETTRITRPGGTVLWVSSLGAETPIYLPPREVGRALGAGWDLYTADAGWGCWTAARRRT